MNFIDDDMLTLPKKWCISKMTIWVTVLLLLHQCHVSLSCHDLPSHKLHVPCPSLPPGAKSIGFPTLHPPCRNIQVVLPVGCRDYALVNLEYHLCRPPLWCRCQYWTIIPRWLTDLHKYVMLVALYRARLIGGPQVWWILFLLLLTTSASTCLQHSRNLGPAY